MTAPSPLAPAPEGARLAVRLTPRARQARIGGVIVDAGGRAALKASVTAAPEDGKANAALVALLAKTLRLPKSAFEIVAGAADRRKLVAFRGDRAALAVALAPYLTRAETDA